MNITKLKVSKTVLSIYSLMRRELVKLEETAIPTAAKITKLSNAITAGIRPLSAWFIKAANRCRNITATTLTAKLCSIW